MYAAMHTIRKKLMPMVDRRYRQFMFMQDKNHLHVRESQLPKILDKSGAIEWAYINHNKDVDNRGQPIRAHYHVILKYENPQTVASVASLFQDNPQYVQVWRGRINNAYSYLIHETEDADSDGKYHYPDSDVIASFDFPARMEKIRKKIKISPKYEKEQIRRYSEQQITREQLTEELGVFGVASHQQLIDRIDSELANQAHEQWLRNFKNHKMTTLWLHGESGVGKTRLAEYIFRNKKYVTLGSSRDHFQEYKGEHFIIINDLRPNDFEYSDLLRMLDPYQHDKAAPSRYHDKKLNAEKIIITTPYDPLTFYRNIDSVKDTRVDTIDQLLRRIKPIKVTPELISQIRRKIKQRKKAKQKPQKFA